MLRALLAYLACTCAAVGVLFGWRAAAFAADDRSFDVDHLQLALGRSPFFATEGAGEVTRWDWRAAVAYRFAQSPLVLSRTGERREVIQDRSTLELQGAVMFGRWVGLGLALPIVVADRGSDDAPHGAALGDLRLAPRVEILHRGRFGLAGILGLRLPTGPRDRFVGEGMLVFEPRIAFQVKLGILELGTNVGMRFRQSRTYLDLDVSHEIFVTLAAAVTPKPYISAVLELHGDTALSSRFAERSESPLELLAGVFGMWRGVRAGLSAGFGLAEGWGSPRSRVMLTVEYRRFDRPAPPPPPPVPAPPPPPPPEPEPPPPPEPEPEPIVTPEEPAVALHPGRIELADPIFFDKDRKRVKHRYHPELQQLARVLKRRTELTRIWIEGHADATGPEAWNLQLSRLRAESVAKVLIAEGVEASRLRPVGFGEARPLVESPRGAANEKNRRVHFFTDSAPDSPPPAGIEAPPLTPTEEDVK